MKLNKPYLHLENTETNYVLWISCHLADEYELIGTNANDVSRALDHYESTYTDDPITFQITLEIREKQTPSPNNPIDLPINIDLSISETKDYVDVHVTDTTSSRTGTEKKRNRKGRTKIAFEHSESDAHSMV